MWSLRSEMSETSTSLRASILRAAPISSPSLLYLP